jgi:RNA polymerase subunit RPABC4/transcription elongation factor Spt4
MEQPCHKCGQAVEEGTPFCPHCSAPQIRVVIAESPQPSAALSNFSISAQGEAALPASQTVPVLAAPMQWSGTFKPCALAALVAALLLALHLHPAMAIFTAGFLSVVFYRLSAPGVTIKTWSAAGLGALGGVLWFAIVAVFSALGLLVLNKGQELRSELIDMIGQAASQTTDPQRLAVLDWFKTPGGLEFLIVGSAIFALIMAIVVASIGGALAGVALRRRGNG